MLPSERLLAIPGAGLVLVVVELLVADDVVVELSQAFGAALNGAGNIHPDNLWSKPSLCTNKHFDLSCMFPSILVSEGSGLCCVAMPSLMPFLSRLAKPSRTTNTANRSKCPMDTC